jgi:hypothetical protein
MRAPAPPPPHDYDTLAFDLREGASANHFLRRGPVAAHLVASSGRVPRLLVAFPAGNTGAGLWFDPLVEPAALDVDGGLTPVARDDGLRGVSATIVSGAPELRVRGAVLGSVRALRRYAHTGVVPDGMRCAVAPGDPFAFRRTTLDGHHRVELLLDPRDGGAVHAGDDGTVTLRAAPDRRLRFGVTALADDPPLTPIPAAEICTAAARPDARALQALAFLSYEEKLLAGSWRFLTYFGRDTLLAVRLLLPVLEPRVVEAGLGAVIDRLGPGGEVAHEEAIGDWAAHEHLTARRTPEDLREPVHDRSMIDDDFLLAPGIAAYLLDTPAGRARYKTFLARRTPSGERYADAIARNLAFVLARALPFAEAPGPRGLVALADGTHAGDWRDSEEGLGLGRVPFSVNGALVPAALEAAERLYRSPLLGDHGALAERAARLARAWRDAGVFFRVELGADEARRRVDAYARSIDLDPGPALASIDGPIAFPALALGEDGARVPVMSSDDGFTLLFTTPSPATLEEAAARILRPFPAGLSTPVGVVVANPAYAPDAATHALFTTAHYHGTVVWSWQQAMLAAGLSRQLARADLPLATRARLAAAKHAVRRAIAASEPWRTTELWSFDHRGGAFEVVPFGSKRAHQDESNAAQLWSTVYLAVEP